MTVATAASTVNHALLRVFGNLERAGFIFIQRPEVILFAKIGLTPGGFICFEYAVAVSKQSAVTQRLNPHVLFTTGGAIAGKGIHVRACRYHSVDDPRNLVDVGSGNGGHHNRADPRAIDIANLLQCGIKTSGLAKPVVRSSQTVDGKLVFLAAVCLHSGACFIRKMKWISHDREWNFVLFQQCQQLPEIRMQDGISAGDVKIRLAAIDLTKVETVRKGFLHL